MDFLAKDKLFFEGVDTQWLILKYDSFEHMFIRQRQSKAKDVIIGNISSTWSLC